MAAGVLLIGSFAVIASSRGLLFESFDSPT